MSTKSRPIYPEPYDIPKPTVIEIAHSIYSYISVRDNNRRHLHQQLALYGDGVQLTSAPICTIKRF